MWLLSFFFRTRSTSMGTQECKAVIRNRCYLGPHCNLFDCDFCGRFQIAISAGFSLRLRKCDCQSFVIWLRGSPRTECHASPAHVLDSDAWGPFCPEGAVLFIFHPSALLQKKLSFTLMAPSVIPCLVVCSCTQGWGQVLFVWFSCFEGCKVLE